MFNIETEEIDLLDFCDKNQYLIFRDISGRNYCYDITNYKDIKDPREI